MYTNKEKKVKGQTIGYSRGIAIPLVLVVVTLLFVLGTMALFLLSHGRKTLIHHIDYNEGAYKLEATIARGIWLTQNKLKPEDLPYYETSSRGNPFVVSETPCDLEVKKVGFGGYRITASVRNKGKVMSQVAVVPAPIPFYLIIGKP